MRLPSSAVPVTFCHFGNRLLHRHAAAQRQAQAGEVQVAESALLSSALNKASHR